MTNLTTAERAAIRERAEKARELYTGMETWCSDTVEHAILNTVMASVNDLPRLLDTVDALEAELSSARSTYEHGAWEVDQDTIHGLRHDVELRDARIAELEAGLRYCIDLIRTLDITDVPDAERPALVRAEALVPRT